MMKNKYLYLLVFSFFYFIFTPVVEGSSNRDYENPHSEYTNNTNVCSLCHSTHRAKAEKLLVATTVRDTCYMCHDGRGSKYDVKNGKTDYQISEFESIKIDSLGGGFNPAAGFTSSHSIEEMNAPKGGAGESIFLTCTSCHNPHGSDNYRIINNVINGKEGIVVKGSITRSFFTNREIPSYESGISNMCSACHNDYQYTNSQPEVIDKTQHRHPINVGLDSKGEIRFTTLPTEGAPSGAYPNPNTSTLAGGGTLFSGANNYYYIITASNITTNIIDGEKVEELQESHQGYIKRVNVPVTGRVILKWEYINNAVHYSVYRAGPLANQPTALESYSLVARSSTDTNRHRFQLENEIFTFVDDGSVLEASTVRPPAPNSQSKVTCITCHFAHGTKKLDAYTGESHLRRLDNMGVCQECHKK
ncbi:cytochrome c3 family protein [Anaerobacillus isosaccharinicus]|uniref:Cytochrome c3 family protein n=2 Tax=Anaerobacillus isosaccharinicus TaxID=1532552 RepID=A0A7S7RBQ5_9BACI|nr:cytochrome c3 family protein [Anaerobacillus isosaccharinicus]MBA5585438.1 hypothetical protein [Anaerobacillus isosaccharinicus]QOY36244.1 hypothetical protein AWH56_000660 [Anaerobacillus isosaccharinicus]